MQMTRFTRMLDHFMEDGKISRKETNELKDWLRENRFDWTALSALRNAAADHYLHMIAGCSREGKISESDAVNIVLGLGKIIGALWKFGVSEYGQAPPEQSAHFAPSDNLAQALSKELEKAVVSIDIAVYTITYNQIRDTLLQISRKHGAQHPVKVRIITDDDKVDARGSDIRKLHAADAIEVRIDGPDSLMHHKFAVIDRKKLITGSFNWTRSATLCNYENFTITDDPVLVEMFAEEFASIWRRCRALS